MPDKLLLLSCLIILIALAAALLIVLPAPGYLFWELSVAASEWSLWLSLIGVLCALVSWWLIKQNTLLASVTLIISLAVILLGCYPLVSAWRVARANHVNLSVKRYFLGALNPPRGNPSQTFVFNEIDGKPLSLDVFAPDETGANAVPRPAVVVIHGGGWDSRDKSDFPQWDNWLASNGYVVFDIQYRLSPQPNWITATGDVKCAVGWIKNNAAKFKIDPARIALLGRSAGGHLALLAGYAPDANELPASCQTNQRTDVAAIIALYAPTDLAWAYRNPANNRVLNGADMIGRFVGGAPENLAARYSTVTPQTYVNAQTPPTLLFQGGKDQIVRPENMSLLSEKLNAANVPHRAVSIPYAQHGYDYNFNGWGSQITQSVMLEFLGAHLKTRK